MWVVCFGLACWSAHEPSIAAHVHHSSKSLKPFNSKTKIKIKTKIQNSKFKIHKKKVYSECPSYDRLVPALLSDASKPSLDDLPSLVAFTPHVPVRPMLAKATNGVGEVLERFGADQEFTCEYKYDGERCQVG